MVLDRILVMNTKQRKHRIPTDNEVMAANAAGMDAFDDGKGVHDNPFQGKHIDLVNAWHEGFNARHDRSGE